MTTPQVDVPRDIPLENEYYMPVDSEGGYPFDRDFDRPSRDSGFRSQLDDIAKRHPEFAQHLSGTFPFRSRTGSQREDPEFKRFTERAFPRGRTFEEFGFPFDRSPTDEQFFQEAGVPPEYYQNTPEYYQQQPAAQEHYQQPPPPEQRGYYRQPPAQEFYQPPPQAQPQKPQEHPQPQEPEQQQHLQEPQPQIPGENKLQQSNTADLNQEQEPVNDRNQRSMSAPPDNRPRFTSSINIPVGGAEGRPTMGAQQSQNQPHTQQSQQQNKPVERVIPIQIESRGSASPKQNTFRGTPPQHSQPPPPQHGYNNQPPPPQGFRDQPTPDTIFGRRPDFFNKFVDKNMFDDVPRRQFNQQNFRQPQFTPQPQASPQFNQQQSQQQPKAPQSQARAPQPPQAPQNVPQEPQKQPTPPPAPQKLTPIEQIQLVHKDVTTLFEEVEKFTGKPKDKQYLYLDEMFTRHLIKLDNIDTQGQDAIRSARKEAIKYIEKCLSALEEKANANQANENPKMEVNENKEVEEKKEEEKMEVEHPEVKPEEKMDEGSQNTSEEKPNEDKASGEKPAEEKPAECNTETRAVLVTDLDKAQKESEEKQNAEAANVQNEVKPEVQNEEAVNEEKMELSQENEEKSNTEEGDKKEKKKIKKKVVKEKK